VTAGSEHRWLLWGCLSASAVATAIQGIVPLFTAHAVNDAVAHSTHDLSRTVLVLLLFAVANFTLTFARRYLGGALSLQVQLDLRNRIFRALQRLDGVRQDELRVGQVVSRVINDLQLVQGLLMVVPLSFGSVVLLVVSLAAMLYLSPVLTLVAVLVVPLAAVTAGRSRRRLLPATWLAAQRAADVSQVVEETVTGVRVVKGFGQEEREVSRMERACRLLFADRMLSAKINSRFAPTLGALPQLGQVGVLGLGGYLALTGRIDLGTFVAFAAYLAMLSNVARILSNVIVTSQLARAGVERVYDLVDTAPVLTESPRPVALPAGPLGLQLHGVRFGYGGDDAVLDGLDLEVRPGETVALVGASGSGKSTVSLLLGRFFDPSAGSITVGGVDIRELALADLRAAVGIVFEEAFLFSDTIRANIAYGRPDASDAEVRAAGAAAAAEDFVLELPDGYDTVVGERGLTLSGGQRQRIALARALLTGSRALVLDDATSAVDTATEARIHHALAEVTRAQTTLLIAHRRSTLQLADRIAVLDAGRVIDIGTEEELTERCPLFVSLLVGPEGARADDAAAAQHEDDLAAVPASAVPQNAPRRAITAELWPAAAAPDGISELIAARDGDTARPFVPGTGSRDGLAGGALGGGGFGGGRGGGGGGGGAMGGMAGIAGAIPASPELLKLVAALPPSTEEPVLPGEDPRAEQPDFRFSRLIRPVRGLLVLALLLVVGDALASIAFPLLARYAVDGGVMKHSERVLVVAAGIGLLVVAADWIFVAGQTVIAARAGERLLFGLRIRSFAHLQRLGMDFYERELAGRIMTRMTTDVDALSQFLQTGLNQAVVSVITVVGVAGVLVGVDPRLSLVALAPMPVLIVATIWFRRVSGFAYSEARERISMVNADFQENVSGLRVAQAYGHQAASYQRIAARGAGYLRSRMRAQRYIATFFPFVNLLSDGATAVILAIGAREVARGQLSAGVLTAFLLYLSLFFAPVQQLSQVFDGYQQARVGLRRIGTLLRTPSSIVTEPGAIPAPAHLTGPIELHDLRFRYSGAATDALKGIELTLRPGETVALVGPTGAGKSTVVKLLARFYDVTDGAVLIDGTDLRSFDLAGFRARLGVVPQEAHLFSGDVASNIAYGRPDASPEQIEAAADAVGALPMLHTLRGGFRHPVSERGGGLSAGQKQLVALARAELVDPDLLLLDEATAALDPAAERVVLEADARLRRRSAGRAGGPRTTVLIAHRLATAARADRVVVMEAGRVVEDGTHEQLLAANGLYAGLWAADGSAGDRVGSADAAYQPVG
jgi:ATP-binding cassette subfamily B protein